LTVVSASSDGVTHVIEVEDKIKQIPANKADDLITFYAWVTVTTDGLQADAITIHHKVNDHQAFGKAAQSSPVQSFHPHQAHFDANNCIIGLESPKADFKVQILMFCEENHVISSRNFSIFSLSDFVKIE
jgi:hypothetical protein